MASLNLSNYLIWLLPTHPHHLHPLLTHLRQSNPTAPPFSPHITLFSKIPLTHPLPDLLHGVQEGLQLFNMTRIPPPGEGDEEAAEVVLSLGKLGVGKWRVAITYPVKESVLLASLQTNITCALHLPPGQMARDPHLSVFYPTLPEEELEGLVEKAAEVDGGDERGKVGFTEVWVVRGQGGVGEWEVVGKFGMGGEEVGL